MADTSKVKIELLRQHFEKLVAQLSLLQQERNNLMKNVEELQEQLAARDIKIAQLSEELAQCEVRYKNLQISQGAQIDAQQLQENREKFANLVREIDKCISLLNG